ncbi:penicillin-binding protein 2 [Spirochaeta thermophila]|uniref:Penicillin-binding protein n=1 Tax=Winmispira thermophila (strain ATCC 49972 / DSM 6192 / RI 19.B1) TaxID=665571 RepID=E0RSP6_WINT6|nr:penicillin-binding protein 2 [Spirochaeta thermophila]ADN02033.1 penicillin-binding protein [Spirochaeta thermophila DSM 6192]
MKVKEYGKTSSNQRISILIALSVVIVFLYIGRLFSVQVVENELFSAQSQKTIQRAVLIPARRGDVFARDYRSILATSRDSFTLLFFRSEVGKEQLPPLVDRLGGHLGVSARSLLDKIESSASDPVVLAQGVGYEQIVGIAEHLSEFPGIGWQREPSRYYPYGDLFAHVVGYIGEITQEELTALYNKGYTQGTLIGKSGVEKVYDELLRGKTGLKHRIVDASGQILDEQVVFFPENGKTLVLTLDPAIQTLIKKALGPRNGAIVVLKPSTGEILGLYSYPSYDSNLLYDPKEGRAYFTRLSLDKSFPFINRAIQSSYAPASTFKIVMTAAVLMEKVFPPDRTIVCRGEYRYGDRVFKCWKEAGHGPLALEDALAQSCDVYFYTVGAEYLGVDRIAAYAKEFGLGEPTGIDLPGEVRGIVPTPRWKMETYNYPWVGGDTVNMSIGQGFLSVTPLQLADVVASVVNGGFIMRPHVLKEVRDPTTGEVLEDISPSLLRTSNITEDVFSSVRAAMRGVVTHGTALPVITTPIVEVAGKTGTGEVGLENRYTSWFVGYAPYDALDPEEVVVVSVLVEATNDWEWWAPKAANIVFHGIFSGLSYEDTVRELRQGPARWYLPALEDR